MVLFCSFWSYLGALVLLFLQILCQTRGICAKAEWKLIGEETIGGLDFRWYG